MAKDRQKKCNHGQTHAVRKGKETIGQKCAFCGYIEKKKDKKEKDVKPSENLENNEV